MVMGQHLFLNKYHIIIYHICLGSTSINIYEATISDYHPGANFTSPFFFQRRAGQRRPIVAMEDLDPGLQGYSVALQQLLSPGDVGLSENVGYIPNDSHLIGIMIMKTIGFRGTLFSDKPM